jgi:hypothetical protein
MAESNPTNSEDNSPPPTPPLKVSEDLLKKLHEADQQFSAARHRREEAIDEATPESTNRDAAAAELRDAEKRVEDVTEEIDRDLHPPA